MKTSPKNDMTDFPCFFSLSLSLTQSHTHTHTHAFTHTHTHTHTLTQEWRENTMKLYGCMQKLSDRAAVFSQRKEKKRNRHPNTQWTTRERLRLKNSKAILSSVFSKCVKLSKCQI